ncbi:MULTISPECIES: DUF1329 domain-containing protein [Variovorax]|uniref:DUF1329 domain-containing protein n=1 Tax=Variovorax TaxID=34072 RepID=UPI001FD1509D
MNSPLKSLITAGALCLCFASAHAAVSPEEAKRLGNELTGTGAQKAGNKEGTIPTYTGGLTAVPASFDKSSNLRPDPFAEEKPLFSIDAGNMDRHAERLSEGAKALLKAHPDFRLEVYPTHRTVAFPKAMLDNTLANATRAKLTDDGLGATGARGGVPFPIPANGNEVMLNHLLRYLGASLAMPEFSSYFANRGGTVQPLVKASWLMDFPYHDDTRVPASPLYYRSRLAFTFPPNQVGNAIVHHEPADYSFDERRYWLYLPGQRRVRQAPEMAYDTPNGGTGGISTQDDVYLFNGKMDRFDWKLVGKKELYVPYNAYRFIYNTKPDEVFLPKFINPQVVRWELHRVWLVEATRKPGARHVYSRRTFYVDEDSWHVLASDQYDGKGQLWRAGFAYLTQAYDAAAPVSITAGHYDLAEGAYYVNLWPGASGIRFPTTLEPDGNWTPESLAGQGIR